jgi:hypothetical protein
MSLPPCLTLEVDTPPSFFPVPKSRGVGSISPADFFRRQLLAGAVSRIISHILAGFAAIVVSRQFGLIVGYWFAFGRRLIHGEIMPDADMLCMAKSRPANRSRDNTNKCLNYRMQ